MSKRYSKDRRYAAAHADLYEFVAENHPDQFKIYDTCARLIEDEKISIPKGSNAYFRFGRYEDASTPKGNAIDFLVEYLDYTPYGAIFALTEDMDLVFDDEAEDDDVEERDQRHREMREMFKDYVQREDEEWDEDEEEKDFTLPPKSDNCRNLYAYMIRERGLSEEVVRKLVVEGYIYQDMMRNIVFCNKDGDWIEERGTNTFSDRKCIRSTCRGDDPQSVCPRFKEFDHGWCAHMNECPDYKKNSFHRTMGRPGGYWAFDAGKDVSPESRRLYICEAALDAVSLYELQLLEEGEEAVKGHTYISIGGVGKSRSINRVIRDAERNGVKKDQVFLAVDNDDAGEACRARYPELGFTIPEHKDWNEDLKDIKGL